MSLQIATEASRLCTFHPLRVVTLVGGTNINSDKKALFHEATPASIVVGTPGRLLDLLESERDFAMLCAGVFVLILDEADRLLDMGFKKDIDKLLRLIGESRRGIPGRLPATQTMLFSATINDDIRQIASISLKAGYHVVDTVGEDTDQTHSHVPQFVLTVPLEQQVGALARILEERMAEPDFKIIVFFVTARQTELMSALFSDAGVPVLEMHSRKSQPNRIKTADAFRSGANVIMFSSDVSARGMDYPNVTFVLQVGLTDKSQYIHRLGRTARAGKTGCGCLLLAPFEERPMKVALGAVSARLDH